MQNMPWEVAPVLRMSRMTALIAAALGAFGAIGIWALADQSEPHAPRVGVSPQSSVASASGIRIALREATFSGTDTTVLAAIADGDGHRLTDINLEGEGAEGDFAFGRISSLGATGTGEVVFRLPAVSRPGTVQFTIRSLTPAVGPTVEGPWLLSLEGPPQDAFGEVMRIEDLKGATLEIGGRSLLLSARRTSTRTLVSYILPDGLLELSGPLVTVGGRPQPELSRSQVGAAQVVEFAPTKFGTAISLSMGQYAVNVDRSAVVSVAFASFANRNGLTSPPRGAPINALSEAPILSRDVIDGAPSLLLRAGYAFDLQGADRREILQLVVAGNWHARADEKTGTLVSPSVVDGRGIKVQLAGVNSAYSKAGSGEIGQGETTISLVNAESLDLSRLTLILDGPMQVIGGQARITLSP
jgi:hypothetical protein